jgi:hypothetical protein
MTDNVVSTTGKLFDKVIPKKVVSHIQVKDLLNASLSVHGIELHTNVWVLRATCTLVPIEGRIHKGITRNPESLRTTRESVKQDQTASILYIQGTTA